MMGLTAKHARDEGGYVLVLALLTLLILTLIAIGGLTSSSFESTIAGNDWRAKRSFYKAESGTELGAELLEYNFSCGAINSAKITGNLAVYTPELFHNTDKPADLPPTSASTRDVCWASANPANPVLADCAANSNAEQTDIVVYGDRDFDPGSAIQMAAGYEGRGKSAAAGGVSYTHQIIANNTLADASSAAVQIEWRHVVGMEDSASCH